MKYCLFGILLFCNCGYDSTNNRIGTLIIVSVATDGILIASDSRATELEVNAKDHKQWLVSGYVDSCQKIVIVRGVPIGCAGVDYFAGKELDQIVKNYNGTIKKDANSHLTFGQFVNYLTSQYPAEKYPMLSANSYLSAYYFDDVVFISRVQHNSPNIYAQRGKGAITVASTDLAQPLIDKYIPVKNRTVAELKPLLEKVINEFSKIHLTIGGPITILKINKDNSCGYIQNDFSKKPSGGKLIPIKKADQAKWKKDIYFDTN